MKHLEPQSFFTHSTLRGSSDPLLQRFLFVFLFQPFFDFYRKVALLAVLRSYCVCDNFPHIAMLLVNIVILVVGHGRVAKLRRGRAHNTFFELLSVR